MLLMTALVAIIAVSLPYTAVGSLLGFVPLPIEYVALILGIVMLYFLAAELTKRWFYHRIKNV